MKIRLSVDMEEMRIRARDRLDAHYASLIPDPRIQAVRDAKAEEARRVMGGEEDAPLLISEAEARGATLQEMAELVLQRQREDRLHRAPLELARQKLQAAIQSAKSPAEIDSILASIGKP